MAVPTISKTFSRIRSGAAALLLVCFFSACGNDIEKTKIFEPQTLPDNTVKNAKVQRSENGKLQLIMRAPLIENYSVPEKKTEYPKGVNMHFYSGWNKPTGILRARYAVSYDTRQTTIVRDSVVIIDAVDGVFPRAEESEDREAYLEERRLFFVAMTRAKEKLTVYSYADADCSFPAELKKLLNDPPRRQLKPPKPGRGWRRV